MDPTIVLFDAKRVGVVVKQAVEDPHFTLLDRLDEFEAAFHLPESLAAAHQEIL